MSTFYGCDVSRWQGIIDWNALNPGAAFVFFKGGGGDDGNYVDSQFQNNLAGVRLLGNEMPHGWYWFASMGDPIAEANYFVDNCCSDIRIGEVLVLDDEVPGSLDPTWAKQWLDQVANRVGFKPIIYLSDSEVLNHDWSPVVDAGYGLWLADWAVSPADNAPLKYWPFYAFQQYTDNAHFPGIEGGTGNVDADAFFASAITDFFKYGKQPSPSAPVALSAPPEQPIPVPAPVPPAPAAPTTIPVKSVPPTQPIDIVKPVKKKEQPVNTFLDDAMKEISNVDKSAPVIYQTVDDLIKPGVKTSEWWTKIGVDLAALNIGLFPSGNPTWVRVAALGVVAVTTIAYIAYRTMLKRNVLAILPGKS